MCTVSVLINVQIFPRINDSRIGDMLIMCTALVLGKKTARNGAGKNTVNIFKSRWRFVLVTPYFIGNDYRIERGKQSVHFLFLFES